MKVKLTEGQLRNMIAESIIKHLNEELMKVPSDYKQYDKYQKPFNIWLSSAPNNLYE